jgi:hypothetical protein
MKLTNLSQVREALELAEQNSNQTFKIIMCCDQLKNALVAIGERYGIAGHCATLTAIGRTLLAALRAAATVADIERERDEARAAARWLAAEMVELKRECCPCTEEEPSKECCVEHATWRAYTLTGGTVPAEQPAPSEAAQQFRCDWQPKPDNTFGLRGEEAQAGSITLSVTLCDDGQTYSWCIADIMKVWMIAKGYEPSLPAAKGAAEAALQKHEEKPPAQ